MNKKICVTKKTPMTPPMNKNYEKTKGLVAMRLQPFRG